VEIKKPLRDSEEALGARREARAYVSSRFSFGKPTSFM